MVELTILFKLFKTYEINFNQNALSLYLLANKTKSKKILILKRILFKVFNKLCNF